MSLSFVLKREKVPVRLQDAETGKWSYYILHEMDGTQRDSHMNTLVDRAKLGKKGKVEGIKSFDRLMGNLVQACLFEVKVKNADAFMKKCTYVAGSEKPVSIEAIQAFPAHVLEGLHTEAKRINSMEDEPDEDEDGEDTGDTKSEAKAKNV